MSDLATITPDWPVPARVRAAFTLRTGGVSTPPFDSLNLGSHVGDALDAVLENRRRVRDALGLPAEPAWLQQVHGTDVVDLDVAGSAASPEGAGSRASADGVVARLSGRVCVIQVADCMPVLFAARDGSAVGAAHAGWRGLAAGVLEETVRTLGVAPAQLLAWLGPTIGQAHFEVGDDVRAAFMATDAQAASAFEANARGRWQCDLYALARRRLAAIGIGAIYGGGALSTGAGSSPGAGSALGERGGDGTSVRGDPAAGGDDGTRGRGDVADTGGVGNRVTAWCTYADPARFFSYRREGQCGRMAALIWLD